MSRSPESAAVPFDFEIAEYRFHLKARDTLVFPLDNKGNVLRGAFGTIFKKLCCGPSCLRCVDAPMRQSCPYAQVFEPSPPPGSERLSANQDIPRPFVFRPPLDSRVRYERGETFDFGLLLFGSAVQYFPYFVLAFCELADRGIGIGRGRAILDRINARYADGGEEQVYANETHCLQPERSRVRARNFLQKGPWNGEKVTLSFLTPTLIKHEGREIRSPEFHQIVKRLRDRVNAIGWFYAGRSLDLDFAAFGRRAESVRTISGDTEWVSRARLSTRTRQRHSVGGFVGEVTYSGQMAEFLPLLRLGEWTHVGKHAVWGNGWYRLRVATDMTGCREQGL